MAAAARVESHQQNEVDELKKAVLSCRGKAQELLLLKSGYYNKCKGIREVRCTLLASTHDSSATPSSANGKHANGERSKSPNYSTNATGISLSHPSSPSTPSSASRKVVHFIRHGEGNHNVAQREWRARKDFGAYKSEAWDRLSEPYTIDNDPKYRFIDAQLTAAGQAQAEALRDPLAKTNWQAHVDFALPEVELLLVSPLRRATETGLRAAQDLLLHRTKKGEARKMKIVAIENLHEVGGRHTCDKRLDKVELEKEYSEWWKTLALHCQDEHEVVQNGAPEAKRQRTSSETNSQPETPPRIDFSQLEDTDALWHETEREKPASCAARAVEVVKYLQSLPETHIVIAAHSALLLTLFNAVLTFDSNAPENASATGWFGTGEMRSVLMEFLPASEK
ncbi:unnamed protein product [Amoebophrya sp. A25]|nr:unnamed protein product [Amoebophrya sp. A25]|eukprot:GSA25T00005655001.1